MTTSCAKRIKHLANKRGDITPDSADTYLRVLVDAGGCSGFQYEFSVESDSLEPVDDGDIVLTKDGARVVVDDNSLEYLRGSSIDYVEEMVRSSFAVVDNPNSESACGCGSSFAMKNFNDNKPE